MATTTGPVEKLDIGKVIQVSLGLARRHWRTFAILAFIFSAMPVLLNAFIQSRMFAGGDPLATPVWAPFSGLASIFGTLITMIGVSMFQGASIQITIADLNGRAVELGDSLRLALKHIAALAVIAILQGLAIVFGTMLLIAPGMMMACAFAVAAPARVVENIPATGTFRRSRDLTRGNRWRIFGLGVVYFIFVGGFEAALFALFGGLGGIMDPTSLPRMILLPIITMIVGTLTASAVGVLYFELRRIKDGVGATDLATVFD